ncbi:MAG TPA: 2-phosphosulfolactate phosphatase, partial [Capsulimonadaceae bacterium]|nr:2-phosphosulfolactate phosphatase [Capsulimonadaceae bacterium]
CRLEWGANGAQAASERGDVVVIVDTLSFSTSAATAIAHGGVIHPCAPPENLAELARQAGGKVAVSRSDVPANGRYSLSPLTYIGMEPGTRVWLPSPNGATCARCAGEAQSLFVGALVNAKATASAVEQALKATGGSVTVIACGEQWQGGIRFAIEDYLGVGAILSEMAFEKSPEAEICAAGFLATHGRISGLIWDCASGRELRAKGYEGDVRHAAQLDLYDCVAVMQDGHLERAEP